MISAHQSTGFHGNEFHPTHCLYFLIEKTKEIERDRFGKADFNTVLDQVGARPAGDLFFSLGRAADFKDQAVIHQKISLGMQGQFVNKGKLAGKEGFAQGSDTGFILE